MLEPFDFESRTRVVFGNRSLARLGELARSLGFNRSLLVADRGLMNCGYVEEATRLLKTSGVEVEAFHDFEVNPDTRMVEAGRAFAASLKIDSIIGLGGGSSLDCARGINFLLTNGGRMQDYRGYGKTTQPLLPMIGVPTTAGTGSEAQSYALITDAETHVKMACGDPQAAFRVAILDPLLTVSQPRSVTAAAGFDAIAHAVETYVTTRRNPLSELFSREAWALLEGNYERVLAEPDNARARGAMQLGAYYAGMAIENSMLGATHACANPLTAHYNITHGVALALLLPTVVRWNERIAGDRYDELLQLAQRDGDSRNEAASLAQRLEQLTQAGEFPTKLGTAGVLKSDFEVLAEEAAEQWTGRFNPRAFDAAGALEVYECAY
jgi:alcohol dehydrogenase